MLILCLQLFENFSIPPVRIQTIHHEYGIG